MAGRDGIWPNLYCWSIKWELTFELIFMVPNKTQTECVCHEENTFSQQQEPAPPRDRHYHHHRNYPEPSAGLKF